MHKGRVLILFAAIISFSVSTMAQTHVRVWLTDKEEVEFIPQDYFHPAALERRAMSGIPAVQYSDLPVKQEYIETLECMGLELEIASRWFNFVSGRIDIASAERIKDLPFVKEIEIFDTANDAFASCAEVKEEYAVMSSDQVLRKQTEVLGAEAFNDLRIDGKGIRIAVFDVGFKGYKQFEHFDDLRNSGRIERTWDFVGKDEEVDGHGSHGTMVLSCIAGRYKGHSMGLATGATFLLARTERNNLENFAEEERWLAAAEWADKHGVHIINSSLGYTWHRYWNDEMDGKTALVSRAANMAASKGMLVVNAAGNEGDEAWQFIGAPADADSVLSVGGVEPETGVHISFSSYGPTADRRMKPNVCAFGEAAVASASGISLVPGTSFAAPLVTGFAACLWQLRNDLSNMDVFHAIEEASHLHPYFDYSHGFGVPWAPNVIDSKSRKVVEPTFDVELLSHQGPISVRLHPDLERNPAKSINQPPGRTYVYYHVADAEGHLLLYRVVDHLEDNFLIDADQLYQGAVVRIAYKGYVQEIFLED